MKSGENMENHTSVLVIAQPGRVRDGLRALLMATTQIESVNLVDDGQSALGLAPEYQPALVLLDTPTFNGGMALLGQIKTKWPETHCIVLADNTRQQQEAKAAGADDVMLKGFPAAQLFAAIEGLLE
jgi:DNA-binding NarL/FixJ family response regulator